MSENNNIFKRRSVKWLKYSKEFGRLYYKTSLSKDEEFEKLNVKTRGINKITICDLKPSYSGPINISLAKKKDLVDMLDLINENYHNFYLNLQTEDGPDIHPDLSEESDDN